MKYKQLYLSMKNEYKDLQRMNQLSLVGGSDSLLFRKEINDPYYKNSTIMYKYLTNDILIEIIKKNDTDKFLILFTFKEQDDLYNFLKEQSIITTYGKKYSSYRFYKVLIGTIDKLTLLYKLWILTKTFDRVDSNIIEFFSNILNKEINEENFNLLPTDMKLDILPYNDERVLDIIKKENNPKYNEILFKYLMSKEGCLEKKFEVAFTLKLPESEHFYKELCGLTMADDFDLDMLNNPFEKTLVELSKYYKTAKSELNMVKSELDMVKSELDMVKLKLEKSGTLNSELIKKLDFDK